jgi:HPt (histidine-containing phosphotransfer) domain-containing protein
LNDLPVLDPQPLRDLLEMGAEPDLVQELIALLEEDVPIRLAMLNKALAAMDAHQTLMEAHQLKGALSNMGLVRFANLAGRIEALAREGQMAPVPSLIDALPAAYEEALQALKAQHPAH